MTNQKDSNSWIVKYFAALILAILFLAALYSPLKAENVRSSAASILSSQPRDMQSSDITAMSDFSGDLARQIGEAYQLTGLSDIVKSKMGEKLNSVLQSKLQEFSAEAFQKIAEDGFKSGKYKTSDGKVDVNAAVSDVSVSEDKRTQMQAAMKEKLKNWLPQATKELLEKELLNGILLESESLAEMKEIGEKVINALNTTLNGKIDEMGEKIYGDAISNLNNYLSPCQSNDRGGLCGHLNIRVDITDLRGTLDSALNMKNAAGLLAMPLAEAFGESTVRGVQDRIETAFNGQLPPEAMKYLKMGPDKFAEYSDKMKQYLPGAQLKEQMGKWKNKIFGMPLLKLPNGAYCGILAGVAAGHYAQFLSSCGPWGCTRPEELKRGIEVTRVLQWQASNKEAVSLTLGNFLDLAKTIGKKFGLDKIGMVTKLKSDFGKISGQLNKIQELSNKIDSMVTKQLDKVQSMLNETVGKIQGELLSMQDKFLSPLRDMTDKFGGALNNFKSQIGDAMGSFNGLPGNFSDLKNKLGLPDKLFGDIGDFNPMKFAKDKFGKVIGTVTDNLADGVAKVGTDAYCAIMRACGPSAKIEDGEKIPAQNPSPAATPSSEKNATKKDKDCPFDPVFLHNGEFYHRVVDLAIPGRGLLFEFARIYRSRSDFSGVLGYNWSHNYAERIMAWDDAPGGKGVTWVDPEGKKYFFKEKTEGVEPIKTDSMTILPKYVSPEGVFYELYEVITPDGEHFVLRSPDGVKTVFNAYGFMTKKSDRFGNELKFNYADGIKLSSVTDTLGREIKFSYDKIGRITSMTDFSGRVVGFSYDSLGDLIGATSPATPEYPKGKTTRYRYSTGFGERELDHNMIMVMDPKGQIYLRNKYGEIADNKDKVVDQVYGEDKYHIKAEYRTVVAEMAKPDVAAKLALLDSGRASSAATSKANVIANRAWVADRDGTMHIYEHNSDGNLLREWIVENDKNVELVIQHVYTTEGLRVQTIYPIGRYVLRTFDLSSQNRLSQENLLSESVCPATVSNVAAELALPKECRTTEYTYEPIYNETTLAKDTLDNLTKYEYNNSGALTKIIMPDGVSIGYEYNDFGQRTARINPNGSIDKYEYYSAPPLPQVERAGVRGEGYLHKIIRDTGNIKATWTFEYNKVGNIVAITNPDGQKTEYSVNELNQVTKEVLGQKPETWNLKQYYYDENDNITKIVIGNNDAVYEFTYDILDNLMLKREQVSEGRFIETKYEYDPVENLTKITFPEGNSVRYDYDSRGRLVKQTRGEKDESVAIMEYNADGNIVAVTNGVGSTTKYTYNGFGKLVKVTDPLNVERQILRDALGRVVSEITPLSEVQYVYNQRSELIGRRQKLWSEDSSKAVWIEDKAVRDSSGNIVQAVDTRGFATRLEYDGLGRVTGVVDPLGNAYKYILSSDGLLLKEIETAGTIIPPLKKGGKGGFKTQPEAGPPLAEAETVYTYDSLGRLTAAIDAMGNVSKLTYDSLGNLIQKTDELGFATCYEYDGLGRKVTAIQNVGNGKFITTKYEWDGNGRLTALTDDNGNKTEYKYDSSDRLIQEKFADGKVVEYSYDAGDRLIGIHDQNGNIIANSYDLRGSLLERSVQHAEGVEGTTKQNFIYDNIGRLAYAFDDNNPDDKKDDAAVWYSYDSLSRLIGENQNGKWVVRNFDEVGNKTAIMYPSGTVYYKTYDPLSRLTHVYTASPPLEKGGQRGFETIGAKSIATYKYEGADKLTNIDFGNGIKLNQLHDKLKRPVERAFKLPDGKVLEGWRYFYDARSSLTADEDLTSKAKKAYTYDGAERLITSTVVDAPVVAQFIGPVVPTFRSGSVVAPDKSLPVNASVAGGNYARQSWLLDGVGNWLEQKQDGIIKKFQPDNMNAYNKVETISPPNPPLEKGGEGGFETVETFKHDLNGNLTSDNQFVYKYDALNRLIAVTKHDGTPTARYTYDAHNRRTLKYVGTLNMERGTSYIYDGWDLIEQHESPPLEKGGEGGFKQFVYGQRMDELIRLSVFTHDAPRTTHDYYYLSDRTGSIRGLADDSGKLVATYDYDPYGNVIPPNPPLVKGGEGGFDNFTFTARQLDSETGLLYFRNRYYSPKLGRFISRDPMSYLDGPNAYAYVNNRPLNAVDPLGLFALKYHGEMTRTSYVIDKFGLQNISDAIVGGNRSADLIGFNEDLHFDNLSSADEIKQAWNNVQTRINTIISSSDKNINANKLAQEIGQVLHSVQDFYSHSNWVEYWNDGKNGGKKGNQIPRYLEKEVPSDTPLFTGKWGGALDLLKEKKCDKHHDKVNKDSPDIEDSQDKRSPDEKKHFFEDAYNVAQRETDAVLETILKNLSKKNLDALRGVTTVTSAPLQL